jgi:two-component system, OmpR family, KDP operon response regulator KdpE
MQLPSRITLDPRPLGCEMAKQRGRILIVDDDQQIRRVLRTTLISQGYEVWEARRGDAALDLVRSEKFDLILLDINLPDMTGLEVCRAIRSGFDVPIIVLTVCSDEGDKVAALDAGADDYVTKPFNASELSARIRARLKRHTAAAEAISGLYISDDFIIDFDERTVTRQEKTGRLSRKQCQLLLYLVNSRGKPLSHRTLLQAIWGPDHAEQTGLLRALIAQTRKIIELNPEQPQHIVTIPWIGYRFD